MSAYVSDYTFNSLAGISDDSCYIDQKTVQNTQVCNYLLQNYSNGDCSMEKGISFAMTQPGINYVQYGINTCNVEDNSRLTIGATAPEQHDKARWNINQRLYATVPYLGRGTIDPVVESRIQKGEVVSSRPTETGLREKNVTHRIITPLIPTLKANIQNTDYIIEGDTFPGMIRGGVPTRDLMRDV